MELRMKCILRRKKGELRINDVGIDSIGKV